MKANLINIDLVERLYPEELDDGVYMATWSGNLVEFEIEGQTFRAKADENLLKRDVECLVTIEGDMISVKTKEEGNKKNV